MNIACIQMDIAFGEPEKNKQTVMRYMEQIARNVDVVVLPELWTTGYDLARLGDIADENGEHTKTFLSSLARAYNVHIVGGSVAKKTERQITNTMYVVDRNGHVVSEYSKLHLFKLMDEHKHLQAGETTGIFSLDGVTGAGVICYDIRFPEWIRTHALHGAEVLFVVAEWPLARLHHWRTLLMARAIENQCYVVACNRAGKDPNNEFAGHSMIVDPWGHIIAEGDEREAIVMATIDMNDVQHVRARIPIFSDRRPDVYKKFLKND
ncbi:carbon-nitrogen family hydrolase [Anoxybacillus sp. ST4]|uniref:carbon-nitrogen family hydrolase n=1 Tax=Anoxybacillus sp. ST4 TaxID=2864181 RepID=UPI001C640AD6|nr:carbon-nitrogen family hydrolase [Anoxybacillus sp. ST4]MBW7651146.1 carbon-nitrogen family hydrolase [Anoxybacillus sp. ST4]